MAMFWEMCLKIDENWEMLSIVFHPTVENFIKKLHKLQQLKQPQQQLPAWFVAIEF